MRILAFVDLHEDKDALAEVERKVKDADIIVSGGDHTVFEHRQTDVLKRINDLGKTVLMIPGNHESEDLFSKRLLDHKNLVDLHEKYYSKEDCFFIGYGGGGFSEHDKGFLVVANKLLKNKRPEQKLILVLHGPPHGTKTDRLGGSYAGNKDYKAFILKEKPDLVICGHLHENFKKKERIDKTLIINPGPDGEIITV